MEAIAQAKTADDMTRDVLEFAKELEKFVELAAMLVIGCLLRVEMLTVGNLLIAGLLIAVARPSEISAVGEAVPVTVAVSVIVHGISATPLMNLYQAATQRRS